MWNIVLLFQFYHFLNCPLWVNTVLPTMQLSHGVQLLLETIKGLLSFFTYIVVIPNAVSLSSAEMFTWVVESSENEFSINNVVIGKQNRATASKASSSQLSSCSCCTVWQWWQVISKSFTPHCLLMLLFVCACPSRDVFSGTTFNFREAEVFVITIFFPKEALTIRQRCFFFAATL